MKAIWKNQLLAESDDTIVIEGNHYFPQASINIKYFQESDTNTICPWMGIASYFDINVDGEINSDAASFYPKPSELVKSIKGRIAFWKGVLVIK